MNYEFMVTCFINRDSSVSEVTGYELDGQAETARTFCFYGRN